MSETLQSQFPCERCRRHHRRCDKVLPSCEGCTYAGFKCSYTPIVKKKRFVDETKKTELAYINASEVQMARVGDLILHVEIFSATMTGYIPVLRWDRTKQLIEYNRDILSEKRIEYTPKPEEQAVMFGMQVLSFSRQGHNDIAARLYDKTLDFIHESEMNFEIAATYYYIGMYMGGRGKLRTAIDFLTACIEYLQKSDVMYKFILEPIANGHLLLFQNLGRLHSGPKVPPKTIDKVEQSISDLLAQWNQQIPITEQPVKACIILLYNQGGILQTERLEKGINVDLLPIATVITEASRSAYYPLVPPTGSTAIVEASVVQMEYVTQTTNPNTMIDLKQNLIALRVLAARSELVTMMHGVFIEQLSKFVEQYDAIESIDFTLRVQHHQTRHH